MENTINTRFKRLIDEVYGGNKRAFASAVGVSATVVENVVGARQGKPSYDVMVKLCANANISPGWLLTGEGSMLRDGQPAPMGAPTFSPDHETLYKEVLAAKDKTIERDEQLIASLEQRIRDLEQGGSPLGSAPSTYPAQSARLSPPTQSNPPLRK